MAQTTAIAIGATYAESSDLTVISGLPVTVGMMGATSASAGIQIFAKSPDGNYQKVGDLDFAKPVKVIDGPGTYKMVRNAGASCGAWYE